MKSYFAGCMDDSNDTLQNWDGTDADLGGIDSINPPMR